MKKILFTAASFFFLAGTASAALIDSDASTTIGNEAFGVSTGVTMDLEVSASEYAVAAKHLQGVTMYFTEESSTKITPITSGCAAGTAITTGAVTSASADDTTVTTCQ